MALTAQQIESANKIILAVSLIPLFIVTLFGVFFAIQSSKLDWSLSTDPEAYIDFGLLIGSLLTPLIAIGSVILLYLTLIVQMKELRASNESLQKASKTSENLLRQEQLLFELRKLDEYLRVEESNIESLTSISFNIRGDSFKFVTEQNGTEGSINVRKEFHELFDPKHSFDFFNDALTHDEGKYFEKCLYDIRSYGIDLLRYYRCGGSLRHIPNQVNTLLYLTKPFSCYESELTEIANHFHLNGLVKQLSKLHTELSKAQDYSDLFITAELYSDKQRNLL